MAKDEDEKKKHEKWTRLINSEYFKSLGLDDQFVEELKNAMYLPFKQTGTGLGYSKTPYQWIDDIKDSEGNTFTLQKFEDGEYKILSNTYQGAFNNYREVMTGVNPDISSEKTHLFYQNPK